MKISKGRQRVPIKVVVYGPEGIGKTTLASQMPDPLFLDIENGTKQLDVTRIDQDFKAWNQVTAVLNELDEALTQDRNFCRTLVIDTIDVAETLLSERIVEEAHSEKIQSLSDFAYGTGQVKLRERMNEFLKKLDSLREKHGIHIVLLGHSHLQRCEKPDETGSYDRFELKLTHKVASRVKEWCDVMLFLNYKTQVITPSNKMEKNKLVGGQRVIYTTHHTAWDAKNRFNLPEELPLEYKAIEEIFTLNDFSIQVTDEHDPVFAEPSVTLKNDGTVEVHDENGNILGDPDFTEIEPEVPKELSRLMEKDNVSEEQILKALVSIRKIEEFNEAENRRTRLYDLKPEFIEKNLIQPWEGFIKFLKKNAI